MLSPSLLSLAVLLASVAAIPAPAPAASTTPYEAPRPSGVTGGGATEVDGFPPQNSAFLGGGQLWGTAGAAGGELAGTAAGGPNGPNQAEGHATGKDGDGSGFLVGTAAFTTQVGCAGAGYGSNGFTMCLANPTPLP